MNSDEYGNNDVLSAFDNLGKLYLFIVNGDHHNVIKEDGLGGQRLGPGSGDIFIYNHAQGILEPELISWLEAQGFTIPMK